MNVLLTGANGFLGSRLAVTLNSTPYVRLTAAVRRSVQLSAMNVVEVQSLDANTDWSDAVTDQQVVIHAAARAHIMKDEVVDPLVEYRQTNVDGTLNLARQAAVAGVRRFIFISSIKVNGERTYIGKPYTAEDIPAPEDAYGISKYEAEQGLLQIASDTELEVVIIRPPLVYGPGVKGNFSSMIQVVKKRVPLPLGAIKNKRSLVALDNLVDLIITCIDHPAAANQVFLAGDGEDISTTELLRGVAKAAGVSSRLIPVPASVLMFMASLIGKKEMAQRLLGSLQVDISKARDLLGWTPLLSVEEGLRRCFIRNA
jgi:nucleoside-diphosphate-sugar epimerase